MLWQVPCFCSSNYTIKIMATSLKKISNHYLCHHVLEFFSLLFHLSIFQCASLFLFSPIMQSIFPSFYSLFHSHTYIIFLSFCLSDLSLYLSLSLSHTIFLSPLFPERLLSPLTKTNQCCHGFP